MFSGFLLQDFKNGNVDTAFIPKHEQELAEVKDEYILSRKLHFTS